jgi:CheY-like chemotaxis protein
MPRPYRRRWRRTRQILKGVMMSSAPSILVADDDALICKMYSLMLAKAGYQVTTASDGREALACIAQEHPDLIVLDYMMPHLSGIEVLNQMVRDPATASIPVLVISAVVLEEALAHEPVVQQMRVAMLPKPVGRQTLLDHIAQMLDGVPQSPVAHANHA